MSRRSRPWHLLCASFAMPLLGGCVSTLESRLATPEAEGVRYALPIPVLQVTPKPDGTMGVEVLYLPDPNNTYTVTASSFLGAYTLDVKTKDGLLDSVSFSPDGTGVAEAAIGAYGDIKKAEIDAKAKADEAAEAKADEAAKTALAEAKAIDDAQTALNIAVAKRDRLLELPATQEARNAAELAVIEAQFKLADLQADAAAKAANASSNLAMNQAGAGDPKKFPTAYGPIFYRLAPASDDPNRVDLIADAVQVEGATSKPVKPKPKKPPVAYVVAGVPVVRPGRDGMVLKIRVNQAVEKALDANVRLTPDDAGTIIRPITVTKTVENGDTYLYVLFDDRQAAGDYRLTIPVQVDTDGNEANPESVRFRIRRSRS